MADMRVAAGTSWPRRPLRSARRLAFTLIELLIVIAILALLVSILLPSLVAAKDYSRRVVCLTNQKALGTGIQMYAGRYRGGLPGAGNYWQKLAPFLDVSALPADIRDQTRRTMPQMLFCPCDPDPFPQPYMNALGSLECTSYCVNGADTTRGAGGGATIALGLFGGQGKLSDPAIASACMLLTETCSFERIGDLDHPAAVEQFRRAGAMAELPAARSRWHQEVTAGFYHAGRINVLYVDGHGESLEGSAEGPSSGNGRPAGVDLDPGMTAYPSLELPSAGDQPQFWGPPYDRTD